VHKLPDQKQWDQVKAGSQTFRNVTSKLGDQFICPDNLNLFSAGQCHSLEAQMAAGHEAGRAPLVQLTYDTAVY
jgi:hypothetical protein